MIHLFTVMISKVSGENLKKLYVNISIARSSRTRDAMVDSITSGTHMVAVYARMAYY